MNPKPLRWEWASEKQAQAFYHPEDRPLLLVGGQGSGKTVVNCRKIIVYLVNYPRSRFVIVRRVLKDMKKTVLKTFYNELPRQYIQSQNHTDGSCVLINGSEAIFLHLEQEGSASALLSLEANGAFVNEAFEVQEKHVTMLQRRLGRWTHAEVPNAGPEWKFRTPEGKPIPPPMFLADSNPDDGDDEHWMVKRFYEDSPARHEKNIPEIGRNGLPTGRMLSYKDLGYDLIEMPSYENRFLPLENLQQLYASGEIERFVEGKRGSRRGKIHIIHPDSLIPGSEAVLGMIRMRCRLSRVLDHGTTAPTCCTWWGADADSNVYCYREYYQADKLISYHRDAIFEHSRSEQYVENLADPSIFAKTMRRNNENRCTWSVADEYMDRGMYKPATAIPWTRAENTELGTRNRINEYLRFDEAHVNPFTNRRGSPRVFFILQSPEYPLGCVHVHRETALQRHVEEADGTFSTERDEDVVDHAYDCHPKWTRVRVLVDNEWQNVELGEAPSSGTVWTVAGPCEYHSLRRYRAWSSMVEIKTASGETVKATPDHLFLTDAGWIKAADLLGRRCLIQPHCQTGAKSSKAWSTVATRVGTCVAALDTFTSRCTELTTGLFQRAWSCITRTIAPLTTVPLTCAYSRVPSMPLSITSGANSHSLRSMDASVGSGYSSLLNEARSGALSTPAPMSMGSLTAEQLSRRARGAGKLSYRLLRLFGALSGVLGARWLQAESTCATSVSACESDEAWCMVVEHPLHSFTADGFVTSNCLRYYIAARIPVKFAKPGYPKGSIGYDILENEKRQRELDRAEVGYGL